MAKAKKLLSVFLASTMVLGSATTALACTGIYVGSDVSANGSTYMGRSEDIGDLYGKIFGVAEAAEHDADELYKDTYGFSMTYGEFPTGGDTYRYTYVKDTPKYGETMTDEDGNYIGEAYAEAGINEHGVAMSATVSTSYSSQAKAADKLVRTGICEVSLGSLILGGCKTAREAVDFLAYICDTYGAGECNSITISDAEETWIFDTVSGHQYAAVKMADDVVHFNPNIALIDVIDVNDTENVVVSENLISLAEEKGFLSENSDAEAGIIDVAQTYKGNRTPSTRFWQGMYYLNEELAEDEDFVKSMPFTFEPDRELTTMEVLRFLATYGEGTPYESLSGQIANNRQSECHIFEIRDYMADELAILQWQAMADAEFSIYIPYYSALVTEVHEGYAEEAIPKVNDKNFDSINWNFQIINNLCYKNRALVADEVKDFFEDYQESLIEQQEEIDVQMQKVYKYDKELAAEKATELGKDLAEQVLEMSAMVREELQAYLAGDKAEPFELSDEVLEMEPEYSFDNIGGTDVPEKKKKYDVYIERAENGDVEVDDDRANADQEITITVDPDKGYELDELTIVDEDGDDVDYEEGKKDNTFVFEMPKSDVTIEVSFEKADDDTDKSESVSKEEKVEKEDKEQSSKPAVKEDTTIVLTIGSTDVTVDGSKAANDVAPQIKADRTFLPIRVIAEALGATVAWSEADQSVTIVNGDTTVVIYIGQTFALVNGEPVQLDAPAFIENGRTFLPVRFIAEALGATVTWNEAAQAVTIVG